MYLYGVVVELGELLVVEVEYGKCGVGCWCYLC